MSIITEKSSDYSRFSELSYESTYIFKYADNKFYSFATEITSLLPFYFYRGLLKNGQRVYNTLALTDVYNKESHNEQ